MSTTSIPPRTNNVAHRRAVPVTRGAAACLAGTAVAAALFLGAPVFTPAPAQADPMRPLAPPCPQWGFDGGITFHQSNGHDLIFSSTGPRAQGNVDVDNSRTAGPSFGELEGRGISPNAGTIDGDIDGNTINLEVRYSNGGRGKYTGTVDDKGFASGETRNLSEIPIYLGGAAAQERATWRSNKPLRCLYPKPAPLPQMRQCPPGGLKPEVPAGEKCPAPTNAVRVSFTRGFVQWTVNVKNNAGIGGSCNYNATGPSGQTAVSRNFDIGPNETETLQVPPPLPFTTYHVVTSCTGTYDGQQVEFGHDEQDVSL